MSKVRGIGVRHVHTTTSAPFNDVSTVYANYGEPYGTKILGCQGWHCKNMTFDQHELGRNIYYENCTAFDCHYAGWQIRTREVTLRNCAVINSIGPAVWIRGSTSGNAYADHCTIDGMDARYTNLGTSFDSIDWTVVGAVLDDAPNTRTRRISAYKTGGPALTVGDSISPNNSQHSDIMAEDICQLAASNKYAVYLKKVGTTGVCRVEGVSLYSSDAKVVDGVYVDSGVGAATIYVNRVKANGNSGIDYNNQSASATFHYNADSAYRVRRSNTQYFDLNSDSVAHKVTTYSPANAAKGLILANNTTATFDAVTSGALGFDVYVNNVRGIGCDTTGQVLQGGSVISDANRLLRARSFTVATLPSSPTNGSIAEASNGRCYNGAGTLEGAGSGTGTLVEYKSSAWKIVGTNQTVQA